MKKNLSRAFQKKEMYESRLSTKIEFLCLETIPCLKPVKLFEKNRKFNEGMEIGLFKTNIKQQVGGSPVSNIVGIAKSLVPTIAKR